MFGRRTEKKKLLRIFEVLRQAGSRAGIPRYAEVAAALEGMMASGQWQVDEAMARDIVLALDLYSVCRPEDGESAEDVPALSNEYEKIFLRTYKVSAYPD